MPPKTDVANVEYRALCEKFSVPVFHQPWWLDATCPRWLGVVAGSEDSVGIWPVPVEKKLGVAITRNPALTAYLGPVRLSAEGYSAAQSDRRLDELLRRLPHLPVWSIAARPGNWKSEVFQHHGLNAGSRPTYLLKLSGRSEEELLAAATPEVRRRIRRATERITIQNEPEAAAEMFALQTATLNRKGTRAYHTVEYFSRLVAIVHQHGAGALWTARVEGRLVGAQWSVWDAQCCYNMGLARDEQSGEKLSPTALLWHAIKDARARGIAVFDFEGSSIRGIADFFASFGGVRHSYLTLHKNSSLLWRAIRAIRG